MVVYIKLLVILGRSATTTPESVLTSDSGRGITLARMTEKHMSFDIRYFKQLEKSARDSIEHPGKSLEKLPKDKSTTYPTLYVFRHGETYDNRNHIHSGHRNSLLTPKGVEQAEILGKKLKGKKIDLCVVSSLSRSRQTARIALRQAQGKPSLATDDRIIERDYGAITGHSKLKLMREKPEKEVLYRRGYETKPPKGESIQDVEKRVFPFCDGIVRKMRKEKINVAISAHGNSMRAIRKYFERFSTLKEVTLENPLGQDYAAYTIR